MTVVGLVLLLGSSWTLGTLVFARMTWPGLRAYERIALRLLAGLGLTALCLSLLTLAGGFAASSYVLVLLATTGAVLAIREFSQVRRRVASAGRSAGLKAGRYSNVTSAGRYNSVKSALAMSVVCLAAGLGSLGAIAPVTDDDALAYVVPISQHIAKSGTLAVWPDQARSMWPQSQQVLLAYLTAIGGDRLGMLTALEFLLAVGVMSALARRACEREDHVAAAIVIALGAPVVAFQIASAKEDLLVVAATAGTAVCLIGTREAIDFAAAGILAGIAAGAKYPGLSTALVAVLWPLLSRQPRAVRNAITVGACAALTGGLWYGLNLWRYGNPVAPFLFGAVGTTLDAATVREFVNGYGAGRGIADFLLAPIRIFTDSGLFCGRANLFNPLVYVGLIGLFVPSLRRRHAVLFVTALVMYVVWFAGLQNARFLLPAVILIAPAAADVAMTALRRWRMLLPVAWTATAVSLGVVAAVGTLRVVRYAGAPGAFLERETQNYADIQWLNAHLDPQSHRVASDHKVLGYLNGSWLVLDPTYQMEISRSELGDPQRFLEACRRQGITHLFGRADSFAAIHTHLHAIYQNPASRLGGVRFFREPPTESTAVFEIVDAPAVSR